ncbi:hypothetical protein GUITHDRAFT_165645 [Guillardia theta CCMP2712]|uniref:TNFR-Cys domain-containing protein n=2 Tax=Guillardia theta TaxID=55529 RepID=L1IKT2_GUITC|nr:hypothetical protein GUITHDRAFT_165645 [Guillardia theta CCMP2712]EKX36853.1 hypothetical protein GUITHDRAFT_165645 [Guillardia theta CCMP2712]|eukprot:XP_005823833.1 hypothetical protein GUITHDRAFT_165645 [Guillardia theta CCMP2712]
MGCVRALIRLWACCKKDNKGLAEVCNANKDTVCVDCLQCPDNHFSICETFINTCKQCSICDNGFFADPFRPCGKGSQRYDDTYCIPCKSSCLPTEYIASPCNPYQDLVCKSCSACGPNQYLASPCSQYNNTLCKDCAACPANHYRVSECSDTQNVRCNPCSASCPFGYQKVADCTFTQDIQCQMYDLGTCPQNYTSAVQGVFTVETCVLCADYAYEASPGVCLGCDNGKYLDLTTRECIDCPLNSYAPPYSNSVFQCQCLKGHTGYNSSACSVCPINYYRSGSEPGFCYPCPSGRVSKYAAEGISQCLCSNNTIETNGKCENCAIGKYATSDNTCQACPTNYGYYPTRVGCGCPANYYGFTDPIHVFGEGSCSSVLYRGYTTSFTLSGASCTVWLNAFASVRIKVLDIAGGAMKVKYGTDIYSFDGNIDVYEVNYQLTVSKVLMSLNTEGYATVSAEIVCNRCPNASTSSPATMFVEGCQCQTGFSIVNGICQKNGCPAGQYLPNYYDPTCVQCPENTYKTTVSSLFKDCLPCPLHSYAQAGSTSFADCQCLANYYKSGTSCLECPANSISAVNSLSATSCQCKPGYTGPNGGPCTKCSSTQYKPTIGPEACTSCRPNSVIVENENVSRMSAVSARTTSRVY